MSRRKSKDKRRKRLQEMGAGKGNSAYAQKFASGKQMYGDGKRCCGHRFTAISHRSKGAQS